MLLEITQEGQQKMSFGIFIEIVFAFLLHLLIENLATVSKETIGIDV